MAIINWDSINAKCNAFIKTPAGRQLVVSQLKGKAIAGGVGSSAAAALYGVDPSQFAALARTLVSMIESRAYVADSVLAHIHSSSISEPVISEDGSCTITISFGGDMSRPSLEPDKYEGARNIVAIMNKGYSKESIKYVEGFWESAGAFVSARPHRPALNFIQSACAEFEALYGSMYDVSVTISSEY